MTWLVPTFVTVTEALGTAAPVGSNTVPVIPPRLVWADSMAATSRAQPETLKKGCNKAIFSLITKLKHKA